MKAITFTARVSHRTICEHFGLDPEDTRNRVSGLLESKHKAEYGEGMVVFGRGPAEWSPVLLATAVNFLLSVKDPQVTAVRFIYE